MYVCVYVCICVCMYVCMMYVLCMCLSMYVCMYSPEVFSVSTYKFIAVVSTMFVCIEVLNVSTIYRIQALFY